jgi:Ca2+-binding EF-hand superfamily protein
MQYIVDRLMPENEETQKLKTIFLSLDADCNGEVGVDRIKELITNSDYSDDEKAKLSRQLENSITSDKEVTFTQFLTIFLDKSKILTKELV